jgi:exopolysaccharide biosynthesis polyprenyl glycosylphosphotransferase
VSNTENSDNLPELSADASAEPFVFASTRRDVRARRPLLLRWQAFRALTRVLTLLFVDCAGVAAAIFTALALKAVLRSRLDLVLVYHQTRADVAFASLVTVLLFARSGLYAQRGVRPGFTAVLASLFQVTLVTFAFAVVNGQQFTSYYIFYGSFIFAVFYIGGGRYVYARAGRALLRVFGVQRRTVLVGARARMDAVARALAEAEIVGRLSPHAQRGVAGLISDINAVLDEHDVDEIVIVDPDLSARTGLELIDCAHRRGVRVRIAPSTMEILMQRAQFVPGQGVPLFELQPPILEGLDFLTKRVFDVVVALLLIIVRSPLLLVIALAVALTSPGPVLYHSWRPGIGGVLFPCLKFRSMRDDAEQTVLETWNEADGALFKIRDDPRLTVVGRALRRFSLDELPQLFNVVCGQMSLVGPRPLPQRDFERLQAWHHKRYMVLPGMTGLWQVSGRSDLSFDELVRLDFLYLERWSVFLDLTIIFKTVPAVLSRRGAF